MNFTYFALSPFLFLNKNEKKVSFVQKPLFTSQFVQRERISEDRSKSFMLFPSVIQVQRKVRMCQRNPFRDLDSFWDVKNNVAKLKEFRPECSTKEVDFSCDNLHFDKAVLQLKEEQPKKRRWRCVGKDVIFRIIHISYRPSPRGGNDW